jgi:hypothetical protein
MLCCVVLCWRHEIVCFDMCLGRDVPSSQRLSCTISLSTVSIIKFSQSQEGYCLRKDTKEKRNHTVLNDLHYSHDYTTQHNTTHPNPTHVIFILRKCIYEKQVISTPALGNPQLFQNPYTPHNNPTNPSHHITSPPKRILDILPPPLNLHNLLALHTRINQAQHPLGPLQRGLITLLGLRTHETHQVS